MAKNTTDGKEGKHRGGDGIETVGKRDGISIGTEGDIEEGGWNGNDRKA